MTLLRLCFSTEFWLPLFINHCSDFLVSSLSYFSFKFSVSSLKFFKISSPYPLISVIQLPSPLPLLCFLSVLPPWQALPLHPKRRKTPTFLPREARSRFRFLKTWSKQWPPPWPRNLELRAEKEVKKVVEEALPLKPHHQVPTTLMPILISDTHDHMADAGFLCFLLWRHFLSCLSKKLWNYGVLFEIKASALLFNRCLEYK